MDADGDAGVDIDAGAAAAPVADVGVDVDIDAAAGAHPPPALHPLPTPRILVFPLICCVHHDQIHHDQIHHDQIYHDQISHDQILSLSDQSWCQHHPASEVWHAAPLFRAAEQNCQAYELKCGL